MLISCRGVSKSFGASEILSDVSFILEDKEKAALVGVNGAGKTTLFRILAGELEADGGEIVVKKETTYAYMPQTKLIESQNNVYDEMLTVFSDVIELEKNIRRLELAMSDGDGSDEILGRYHRDTHLFEEKNGYNIFRASAEF